ncbi:hypothetical protein [Microbacterium sp. A94]|uniref:hypothetical protein n=1 Tax=Microbacterium sp. A94 TaxID=3450717 RepID=UPI003F43E5F1
MADHTRNALAAAARAMRDVVIPAVDPAHPLALEQATIVAKLLDFVEQRIDHVHERARFELLHYRTLAQEIRNDVASFSPALAAAIEQELQDSALVIGDSQANTQRVRASASALAEVVSASIRASQGADAGTRVELAVLDATKELLDMQRAWFLPQGWESDESVVPALEDALARA